MKTQSAPNDVVVHLSPDGEYSVEKINLTPGREITLQRVNEDISSRRRQLKGITLMDRYVDQPRIPVKIQNEHRSLRLLLEYLDQTTYRRLQHEQSESYYRILDRFIEIPNLIIAAGNFTIATSSKNSTDGSIVYPYSLVITVLAGVTMLSTSVSTYLDIKKKVNDHCLAKNLWRDIESDILYFLSQNSVSVTEINMFAAQIHERIDSNANSSPPVPSRPARKAYNQMLCVYRERRSSRNPTP